MIVGFIPHLVSVIGFKYKLRPKPIFQSHYFLFQYWFCPQGQPFKLALSSDRSFHVIAVIPGVSCSQITIFSYSSKLSKSFSVINGGKPKTCADPLQRGPLSKTRAERRHRPAVGRLLTLSLIVITMKPGDHIKPLRSCNELSRGSRPCTFTALNSAAVNTRARTLSPNGLSSMFRQFQKKKKKAARLQTASK